VFFAFTEKIITGIITLPVLLAKLFLQFGYRAGRMNAPEARRRSVFANAGGNLQRFEYLI
jgi:hypothetical protein